MARSRITRRAGYPGRGIDSAPDRRWAARATRGVDVEAGGAEVAVHGAETLHGCARWMLAQCRLVTQQSAMQFAARTAAVAFVAHQRAGIERLCRYVTRHALALERLSTKRGRAGGQFALRTSELIAKRSAVYQLKTLVDVTRPDVNQRRLADVTRRMSRSNRGRRHSALPWMRVPCTDARDRTGSSDSS